MSTYNLVNALKSIFCYIEVKKKWVFMTSPELKSLTVTIPQESIGFKDRYKLYKGFGRGMVGAFLGSCVTCLKSREELAELFISKLESLAYQSGEKYQVNWKQITGKNDAAALQDAVAHVAQALWFQEGENDIKEARDLDADAVALGTGKLLALETHRMRLDKENKQLYMINEFSNWYSAFQSDDTQKETDSEDTLLEYVKLLNQDECFSKIQRYENLILSKICKVGDAPYKRQWDAFKAGKNIEDIQFIAGIEEAKKPVTSKGENWEFCRIAFDKTQIVFTIGDITNEPADVIVNAANARLVAGSGVCGRIYRTAGKGVFDECAAIKETLDVKQIKTGETVLTSPGKLRHGIKAIAHTVGPIIKAKEEGDIREQEVSAKKKSS